MTGRAARYTFSAMLSRSLIRPVSIALLAIGTVFVAFALLYSLVSASSLPSFMPGHLREHVLRNGHIPRTHAHVKIGLVLFVGAVVALLGAWWLAFRYEPAD